MVSKKEVIALREFYQKQRIAVLDPYTFEVKGVINEEGYQRIKRTDKMEFDPGTNKFNFTFKEMKLGGYTGRRPLGYDVLTGSCKCIPYSLFDARHIDNPNQELEFVEYPRFR